MNHNPDVCLTFDAALQAAIDMDVTYVHYVEGVVAAVHAETHHGEAGAAGGHQH